jgi:hypothetical protein
VGAQVCGLYLCEGPFTNFFYQCNLEILSSKDCPCLDHHTHGSQRRNLWSTTQRASQVRHTLSKSWECTGASCDENDVNPFKAVRQHPE